MNSKIIYHHKLYLGESISDSKLDKLKKRLDKKPLFCDAYLLTISRNPHDQLEILPARQLVQNYYKKYPVYVIGVAATHGEAVLLVEQIVQECLQEKGNCALKEYLLC